MGGGILTLPYTPIEIENLHLLCERKKILSGVPYAELSVSCVAWPDGASADSNGP